MASINKFKVSELFSSLQGESLYTGTPSIFVRFFGCNFQCAGFGMTRGELSNERNLINPDNFDNYNDLPLVTTGCDSYAAWDPRFKKFSPMLSTDELVAKIIELLPTGKFTPSFHLVLTGGEPLLGWQKGFVELISKLQEYNLSHITVETNGTQKLIQPFKTFIEETSKTIEYFFSISAKLPVSGEKWENAIKPLIVKDYFVNEHIKGAFKFVVATDADIIDVNNAVKEYKLANIDIPTYLMPVGGVDSVYYMNNKTVAELALKNGYRYSQRLQIDLWGNSWAT